MRSVYSIQGSLKELFKLQGERPGLHGKYGAEGFSTYIYGSIATFVLFRPVQASASCIADQLRPAVGGERPVLSVWSQTEEK